MQEKYTLAQFSLLSHVNTLRPGPGPKLSLVSRMYLICTSNSGGDRALPIETSSIRNSKNNIEITNISHNPKSQIFMLLIATKYGVHNIYLNLGTISDPKQEQSDGPTYILTSFSKISLQDILNGQLIQLISFISYFKNIYPQVLPGF